MLSGRHLALKTRHVGTQVAYRSLMGLNQRVQSIQIVAKVVQLTDQLLEEGRLPAFAWATFRAYWEELKDISNAEVLAEICTKAGLDAQRVAARIQEEEIKNRLRQYTQELIERGGFGQHFSV